MSLEKGEGPLQKIQDGLYRLRAAAEEGAGGVAANSDRATDSLNRASEATQRLSAEQRKLAEEGKKLADEAVKKDPEKEFQAKQDALDAAFEQDLIDLERRNEALSVFEEEKTKKISEESTKQADILQK
ncbi:hypothetical protein, partial [Mesomycoplasma ovipneumoniae]|uniref:hypothetical protein n=1 Tax=Mesomycoplasma ovipneumoniae TaxID=29562 RepID=UPI0030801C2D